MERRGTLLLVEDEAVLRSLVAQFLRNAGYKVVEAEDGGDGDRRHLEEGPFDLLLVDLNLPVFSGVEVCRRVKARCPSQKVMICSAAIVRENEEALLALGVDHFLTKPYHPEDLIAHIRQEIEGAAARPSSPHPLGRGRAWLFEMAIVPTLEEGRKAPVAGYSAFDPLRCCERSVRSRGGSASTRRSFT